MNKQMTVQAAPETEAAVPMTQQSYWSMDTVKEYIRLTKPGIIRTNLVTGFGGFWLASQWQIDWLLLFFMLIGVGLVMASACVFNNFLDHEYDKKMERTKNRAMPTGRLNRMSVFIYGLALGIVGLAVLYWLTTPLAALMALAGHFTYVFIYTLWLKRTSTWSTSIGGISGAMPPVVGYCAVNPSLDAGAIILFAILFLWQPPHFWALGIRRVEEYRAANYPLLPVVKGIKRTKIQMIPYLLLSFPANYLLYHYGYVGKIFLIVSMVLLIVWTWICLVGFKAKTDDENKIWARKSFLHSIYYLTLVFIVMIIDTVRIGS